MSEGPIKRERAATTVPRIAIPDRLRLCALPAPGNHRPPCGRKGQTVTHDRDSITCPDCLAAIRADLPPVLTSEETNK